MTIQTGPGDRIRYTPSTDISAGSVVVVGELVGVSLDAIEANREGTLMIEGEYLMTRANIVLGGIAVGRQMYWDAATPGATTVAAARKKVGRAVETGGQPSSTPIKIRLGR